MKRMIIGGVAVAGLFFAVGAVFASGGTQVCVPTKEGKPLVTPKGGKCKTGTLTELGAEGKPGPPGANGTAVVARIRSTEAVTTTTEPSTITIPATGGSWNQQAEEINQFVLRTNVSAPREAECTEQSYPAGAWLEIILDGESIGALYIDGSGVTPQPLTEVLTSLSLPTLFEPGKAVTHNLILKAYDACGSLGGHGGGHFTINSVAIDVEGIR